MDCRHDCVGPGGVQHVRNPSDCQWRPSLSHTQGSGPGVCGRRQQERRLRDAARVCENDWGELFDVEFFERGLKKVVWVRNWTADREKYKGPTVLHGVDPRPPRDS